MKTLLIVFWGVLLVSGNSLAANTLLSPLFAGEFTEFWGYRASFTGMDEYKQFNAWHRKAKFKDISKKFDNAYFFKGPWDSTIEMNSNGEMVFNRLPGQAEAHTMVEISTNNEYSRGNFIDYGGYRFMRPGKPYEIEMEIMVSEGDWIQKIPWLLVFQGHAVANFFDDIKGFNPPFALLIQRGRWAAHIRADSRLLLPKDRSYERFDKIDLGPVEPNRWTRFRIRVIWDHRKDESHNDSVLAIWRDNQLLHQEVNKQTFYNSMTKFGLNLGPYLSLGAYTDIFNNEYGPISVIFREITLRTRDF